MEQQNISLTTALSRTVRLSDETPSMFLEQLKKLTPADKQWFKDQYSKELNWFCV